MVAAWPLIALVAALAQLEPPLTALERPEFEVYRRLLLVFGATGVAVYLLWNALSKYRARRRDRK